MSDSARDLFRHTLATLVYRGSKTLRDAPDDFASADVAGATRTPLTVLSHIGDLLDWAHSMASGERKWNEAKPQSWAAESERFYAAAKKLDDLLASDAALDCNLTNLFQGPIADALTHVGQLAMMRRMAGSPISAENYFKADIAAGRVGPDQVPPKRVL